MRGILFIFSMVSGFAQAESILLTAFEPFGGRDTNNSLAVAQETKRQLKLSDPDLHVEVCLLPVEYDRGAQVAQACYQKMEPRPETVISMGEGTCSLRLETMARNFDGRSRDNAGRIGRNGPIYNGLADKLGFTMPLVNMYCALDEQERRELPVSNDAGDYVCNNTALHLRHYLRESPKFGFIHVPNSTCRADQIDQTKNAARIVKMIRATLALPPQDPPFPVTAQEFSVYRGSEAVANMGACGQEFLQKIERWY